MGESLGVGRSFVNGRPPYVTPLSYLIFFLKLYFPVRNSNDIDCYTWTQVTKKMGDSLGVGRSFVNGRPPYVLGVQ